MWNSEGSGISARIPISTYLLHVLYWPGGFGHLVCVVSRNSLDIFVSQSGQEVVFKL